MKLKQMRQKNLIVLIFLFWTLFSFNRVFVFCNTYNLNVEFPNETEVTAFRECTTCQIKMQNNKKCKKMADRIIYFKNQESNTITLYCSDHFNYVYRFIKIDKEKICMSFQAKKMILNFDLPFSTAFKEKFFDILLKFFNREKKNCFIYKSCCKMENPISSESSYIEQNFTSGSILEEYKILIFDTHEDNESPLLLRYSCHFDPIFQVLRFLMPFELIIGYIDTEKGIYENLVIQLMKVIYELKTLKKASDSSLKTFRDGYLKKFPIKIENSPIEFLQNIMEMVCNMKLVGNDQNLIKVFTNTFEVSNLELNQRTKEVIYSLIQINTEEMKLSEAIYLSVCNYFGIIENEMNVTINLVNCANNFLFIQFEMSIGDMTKKTKLDYTDEKKFPMEIACFGATFIKTGAILFVEDSEGERFFRVIMEENIQNKEISRNELKGADICLLIYATTFSTKKKDITF